MTVRGHGIFDANARSNEDADHARVSIYRQSKGEQQLFNLGEDPEEMRPIDPTDQLAAELRGELVQ